LGPLGTAATNGILCQPRVIMAMEKLGECLARETEVLGENLPSAALSTTNPTCCPDANPGRRGGKSASNRLSYDTSSESIYSRSSCNYSNVLMIRMNLLTSFNNFRQKAERPIMNVLLSFLCLVTTFFRLEATRRYNRQCTALTVSTFSSRLNTLMRIIIKPLIALLNYVSNVA
jgi:hypothetical protein